MDVNNPDGQITYHSLVTKQKARSAIWTHFGFPANEKNEIIANQLVVCIICMEAIKYSNNTTNLRQHLANKHPEALQRCETENSTSSPPKRYKNDESATTFPADFSNITPNSRTNSRTNSRSNSSTSSRLMTHVAFSPIDGTSHESNSSTTLLYAPRIENIQNKTITIIEQSNTSGGLMIKLIDFLTTDFIVPREIYGPGFQSFLGSILPDCAVPNIDQIKESLENEFVISYSSATLEMKSICKNKFSLLINRLGKSNWFQFSVCHLNDKILERCSIAFNQLGIKYLDTMNEWLENCCAIVTNFETTENENKAVAEKGIPIYQSLLSIFDLIIVKCFNIADVKNTLREFNIDTCETFSEIMGKVMQNIGERPNHDVVETFFKYLEPLKICIDILTKDDSCYSSIMKPIAEELVKKHYTASDTEVGTLADELKRTIATVLEEKIISNQFLTMTTFWDPRFLGLMTTNDLNSALHYLENQQSPMNTSESDSNLTTPDGNHGLSLLFSARKSISKKELQKRRLNVEYKSYTTTVYTEMTQCPLLWWDDNKASFPNIHSKKDNFLCAPAFMNQFHRLPVDIKIGLTKKYSSLEASIDKTEEHLLWLHLQKM